MPAHPDPQLRRAFLETHYGTAHERLHLGHSPGPPPSWSAPGQRWAILTAWNPQGLQHDRASNLGAQERLRAALFGWPQLGGVNGAGEWTEPSLIVTGLNLRQATRLGQRFGQAAVLWGVGGRAALVWCAGGDAGLRLERYWLTAPPL
ncbi:DUF3293 domain-containing protein [Deinococcus rubellus]|uniref:DUF3293 domain-containing protein n=1 Tax=Deinococcus rubellus TaxID=1889240 RepID=A0ABY5YK90_9DEIO|nr:DUF3293 domain-containing protein [Deinococcus rubellus]UWX65233.1 DUF3293 domain-containing protein [Deinococcus rubellus]